MSSNFNYEFQVWIREGKNLENRKLLGSNAPFVEVSFGDQIKRTSNATSLNNPKWNEKLLFKYNNWKDLPKNYSIKLKDENTLLPNPLLGEYNGKLNDFNEQDFEQSPEKIIQDGYVNLENCDRGELDFQLLFKCFNIQPKLEVQEKQETLNENKIESEQLSKEEMKEEKFEKFEKMEDETHILPTLHVQAPPTIVKKEVEYHKPIEIKETIIHKEKPIIVEQPIIKEKNERYEEEAMIERKEKEMTKEFIHEEDVGNLDQETLLNLRKQRKEEFMDTTPIIEHKKENIQLDTDYVERPTEIKEKEVIYQQPIEIEKTNIEQIQPRIRENTKVEKEHIYQKLAPEIQQADVQTIQEKSEKVEQSERMEKSEKLEQSSERLERSEKLTQV